MPMKAVLRTCCRERGITAGWGWVQHGSGRGSDSSKAADRSVDHVFLSPRSSGSRDYEVFMLSRMREEGGNAPMNERRWPSGSSTRARVITAGGDVMNRGPLRLHDRGASVGLRESGWAGGAIFLRARSCALCGCRLDEVLGDWNWSPAETVAARDCACASRRADSRRARRYAPSGRDRGPVDVRIA